MNNNLYSGMGYLYAVMAALLWAISGSAAKFLFNSGVTSFQLVQLRVTTATIILFFWFRFRQRDILKIERRDIFYFVMLGSVAMAAVQFTYLLAISKINVASAILLQYMAPSLIVLYTAFTTRKKPAPVIIAAVILAAFGCYLVVGAYRMNLFAMNRTGIISGILSAVAFAWYSILGEYGMRKYSSWTVVFYALAFACLSWNIIHPPLEAFMRPYSQAELFWIFYIAVFGTALPFGFYLKAINLINSTRASITATLEPITAGILAFIFLNEVMEPLQISGGILVIFSIIIMQLKPERENNHPKPQRIST